MCIRDSCLYDPLGRYISAQVNDREPVVFQDDLDDVFADVVDISMHSGKNDAFGIERLMGAVLLRVGRQETFDFFKACLCRLCGLNHLRQKDFPAFKLLSHQIQSRNQPLVDDGFRLAAFQ